MGLDRQERKKEKQALCLAPTEFERSFGKPWEFSSKSDSVGGSRGLLRIPVAERHSAVVGGIFVLF